MPAQEHFLDCYEAIARTTGHMLDAASRGDWSAFVQRERDCESWIERIERLGNPDAVLDADGRRRRFELLRRVLRDDAQIRDLMQPWLGCVDRCIGRAATRATCARPR